MCNVYMYEMFNYENCAPSEIRCSLRHYILLSSTIEHMQSKTYMFIYMFICAHGNSTQQNFMLNSDIWVCLPNGRAPGSRIFACTTYTYTTWVESEQICHGTVIHLWYHPLFGIKHIPHEKGGRGQIVITPSYMSTKFDADLPNMA